MPGRTSATLWLTESAQLPAPRRASKTSGPTSFPDMLAEKSDTRPDTGDQRLLPDSGLAAAPSTSTPSPRAAAQRLPVSERVKQLEENGLGLFAYDRADDPRVGGALANEYAVLPTQFDLVFSKSVGCFFPGEHARIEIGLRSIVSLGQVKERARPKAV
jgi:hypothetical protein